MDKLANTGNQVQPDNTTRRWRRFKVEVRVRVLLGDRAGVFGQGSDISEGGMSLFIPAELKVGQTITCDLQLPYCTEKIKLRAVVRNRNGFRYGVEFSGTSDHEKSLITRVCKALAMVQ